METPTRYRSTWTDLMSTEFRQGWTQAGKIRTRFVQAGSSELPVLLMIHGTAGSWETFSGNLEALSKHFNCYAIDLVGSGLSDKPDEPFHIATYVEHISNFMKSMKIDKASFIGVSLGAWVVSQFALSYPDRTEKLVLLAAAGLLSDEGNMSRIKSQRGNAVQNPTWEAIEAIFARLILRPENRIPDLTAIRQRIYRTPEMAQAMKNILVLQEPANRALNIIPEASWRTIKAPVLLIGSVDAPDIYLTTAQKLSTILPNATYLEMKGVNHWAHFEDPEVFNKLCLQFLNA